MTREASRRDVIKFAAVLAAGVGSATASPALGEKSSSPTGAAEPGKPADPVLARAKQSPEGFMLSDPVVVTLDTERRNRTLWIDSASDENGHRTKISVPSWSVRIFRADPNRDECTGQGGVYWRIHNPTGTLRLQTSDRELSKAAGLGPLVMVVRELETVRIYTMTLDLRC